MEVSSNEFGFRDGVQHAVSISLKLPIISQLIYVPLRFWFATVDIEAYNSKRLAIFVFSVALSLLTLQGGVGTSTSAYSISVHKPLGIDISLLSLAIWLLGVTFSELIAQLVFLARR